MTNTQLSNYQISKSNIPKCIVLAAGASTRLRPLTDTMPKCLLNVGGKTLLERSIDNVLTAGITEIGIVVGYRAELIREFVKQKYPQKRIRFIVNPNYAQTNNAYSLLLARRFLEESSGTVDHSLLMLDSDVLFSSKLVPYLFRIETENKIAVRISGDHNVEEIQVGINPDGTIHLIGKRPALTNVLAESIGIEIFSATSAAALFAVLERRVRDGIGRSEYYEAAFQEMIDNGVLLNAVDVSAFPTIEIDTAEDLEAARQLNVDE